MADKKKQQPAVFALDPVAVAEAQRQEQAGNDKTLKKETTNLDLILNALKKTEQKEQQRMAFHIDPYESRTGYGGLYRQKMGLTPNHVLRKIAGPQGDDLVNQILQARANLLASFGRPRTSRFAVGFEFQEINKDISESEESKVEQIKERIDKVKEILWNCGFKGLDEDWHPNLSQFLKQITRDALTVGYCAIEFVYASDPNDPEKQICHSFRAVDSSTIFRIMPSHKRDRTKRKQALEMLQQIENKKFDTDKFDNDEYKWCQVINGQTVQVFTDKELTVYNLYPTTNVEFNGYPLTPIDQALNAIATHINITLHNKLYFENGRASRGMLIFQSDDIDESTIQKIKLQFHQSINSVQNCLHGSSSIWTKEKGQVSLEDYLSGSEEKIANIWTGTQWASGLIYKTDEKRLIETHMRNGITLKTSPDHRFRVLGENGDPIWKEQRDLVVGDYVLSNKKNPVVEDLPLFNGKEVTPELMEVFGWLAGDGNLGDRCIGLYYHHSKEQDIRQRHADILKDFGLDFTIKDEKRTPEQIEHIKEKYGFKSVASVVTSLVLNSKESVGYFRELGFNLSKDGKNVPQWVYTLPENHKYAYLRGLFSADGNNAKLRNPEITICNDKTRNEVKLLLLSAGIRTNLSEGKNKITIKGPNREYIEAKSVLRIKDKLDFFNKIGFLQGHKQPNKKVFAKNKTVNDKLPRNAIIHYCREILEFDKKEKNLTSKQRGSVQSIAYGDTCSRPRLIRYMEKAKYPVPTHLTDYNMEEVVDIVDTKEMVPMFDVSINTEDHMFVSDGFCLHNSWRMPVFAVGSQDNVTWQSIDMSGRDKEFQYLSDDTARVILGAFQIAPDELPGYAHLSRGTNTQALSESDNEYKLTAARDVGLRPLVYDFQDLFNTHILPKFDRELSRSHQMVFAGLEENSPEREATRLGQDMQLHMTYDEVLEMVEKNKIGKKLGGDLPLNQAFQMSISPYLTVGQILEEFMDVEGASSDPRFNYVRDPFWFQYQQILMQKVQMAMQQQMMQQQAMQQQQMGGDVPMDDGSGAPVEENQEGSPEEEMAPPPEDQQVPPDADPEQAQQIQQENMAMKEKWLQDNYERLNKGIKNNHDKITRMILKRHKEVTDKNLDVWEKESKKAIHDILDTVKGKKTKK